MRRFCLLLVPLVVVGGSGCGSPAHNSTRPGKTDLVTGEQEPLGRHTSWINEEELRSLIRDRHEIVWSVACYSQYRSNRWPAALSRRFHDSAKAFGKDVELTPECLEEYRELAVGFGTELTKIVERVEWDEEAISDIRARFVWHERPLSIQVGLAQEDLWAYESILRSVARMNKDPAENLEVAPVIARIKTLEVGQPAAMAMASARQRMALRTYFGRVYQLGTRGGPEIIKQSSANETRQPEMEPLAPEQVAEKLLTGRYVDLAGNPLAADSRPYPEFALLPVHVVVSIDQGKTPNFLDQLSRGEMPLDVKYVDVPEPEVGPDTPIVILPPGRDYVDIEILGVIRIYNPLEKK